MSDLLHNFKYPLDSTGDAMSPLEQRYYENKIIETWREKGCYVDDGELSKFAGETLLPGLFDCHEVIDGDNYDGRFLDDYYYQGEPHSDFRNFQKLSQNKPGLVVGLAAKGPLTYDLYDESGWNIELKINLLLVLVMIFLIIKAVQKKIIIIKNHLLIFSLKLKYI